MIEQTQVEIKDKFCLTIDEASVYFNIGEKKLRKIVADNIDTGFIIQKTIHTQAMQSIRNKKGA